MEFREIVHAEELGDGEEPGGEEADGDGAHDCDGDLAFGAVDFFCEVGGAVEAGEGVVGVYEADYECWGVLVSLEDIWEGGFLCGLEMEVDAGYGV